MKTAVKKDERIQFIIGFVFNFFKLNPILVDSPSREKDIIKSKHIAIYVCRRFKLGSLAFIGGHFPSRKNGNISTMDHCSTLKACNSVLDQMLFNRFYREDVESIVKELAGILNIPLEKHFSIDDIYMSNDMFTNEEIETGKVLTDAPTY